MNAFTATLEAYRNRTEAALDAALPSPDTRPGGLHAAMRYCIESGGKRLRPTLLLATRDLFGEGPPAEPAAAAIELLHTYSLVHDDLPCMDNSPLRRGRPTAHVRFGEAAAVLVGDALLTAAFSVLANGYASEPALLARLLQTLSTAAGSEALIGGQFEDTIRANTPISADDLDYIHLNKTAAMISASLVMGGQIGGADEPTQHTLNALGRHLGLAFQVVDDLLDATGDATTLGKPVQADAENQKNTYPRFHGLSASRLRARELTSLALQLCHALPFPAPFLEALIQNLEHRAH
ncbi:MAG: polyprenyl synthetase family protein [Opitutales bacterium]|nr:polyprenyl synthetase family protein [Opitutales bacterium]